MDLGPVSASPFDGLENEAPVHDSTIPWTRVHSAVVSRFVVVNSTRIHCKETGAAAPGPLLLMLHGWAGAAADWEPLLAALPDRIHAIAVDLPGCGLSEKPDAAYDMPWFLDMLHGLCAAFQAKQVVLAGHSMGGQIAVHFASRYPDMVEKLILIDPYGLKGEEGGLRALAHLGPVVNLGFMLNTRFFIEWAMRANVLYHSPPESLRGQVEEASAQSRELESKPGGALPILMRWRRILQTSEGSVTTAMSFISDPQRGRSGDRPHILSRSTWPMPSGRLVVGPSAPCLVFVRKVALGGGSLSRLPGPGVRHGAGAASAPCIARSTSHISGCSVRPRSERTA